MRKTDINMYSNSPKNFGNITYKINPKNKFINNIKSFGILAFRLLLSFALVGIITGLLILFSIRMYVLSMSDDTIALDLNSSKLALTSFIYVNDSSGTAQEYQRVFNSENRVWVDFKDIPKYMKDAIIAIEDKRFYEHSGVDWVRTGGAVLNLIKGTQSYGGSTITQQLIKNVTDDNQVSLTRKLREIFRAIHLEERYSKDEILEAYLNIVNFGGGSRGVQAAANLYFNKEIQDCSIAQCAAIAGITQNPAAHNPFYHPESNRKRRNTVLMEMFEQGKITREEYDLALQESNDMVFEDYSDDSEDKNIISNQVRNWYIEVMLKDIINDLCAKYNIGKSAAENILFTQGLKIYSAMDQNAQSIVEATVRDESIMPKDKGMELGYIMLGFDGRVLASIGSREEKTGNLLYDRATAAKRQPGSTIKPLSAYTPAIDLGIYNYSSIIQDQPLQINADGDGNIRNWPNNWYNSYKGPVTLQWALEKSANAPAAQVVNTITTQKSYEFLTQKLGFSSLDSSDAFSLSALAAGGTHVGVTVREMTAAFQIFGNGGKFYKPYTYFYVTDRNDKVILDNRDSVPIQAISSQSATIMNRLLRNVITGSEGTGRAANIANWNIIGKTGTTNDDHDSWFIGESPYAVGGIWTGYDNPKRISETSAAIRIWKHIMTKYLEDKKAIDYDYDPAVTSQPYCKATGELANTKCPGTATGYYSPTNMPRLCTAHYGSPKADVNVQESFSSEQNSSESHREEETPSIEQQQGEENVPEINDSEEE